MKRKAGRPIGTRVIEAMEILEREGPLTYAQVAAHMDNVVEMNAHKYCVRGVGYGLATTDKSEYPQVFAVVPGWRDDERIPREPEPKRVAYSGRLGPSSVWALGGF